MKSKLWSTKPIRGRNYLIGLKIKVKIAYLSLTAAAVKIKAMIIKFIEGMSLSEELLWTVKNAATSYS